MVRIPPDFFPALLAAALLLPHKGAFAAEDNALASPEKETSAAGGATAGADGAKNHRNPHRELACAECHDKVPRKGVTPAPDVLAGLKKPPVDLCRGCHSTAESSHHPVVKGTDRRLPKDLPLSASGEVICSTCHDVHQEEAVSYLLRGYDTGRYIVRM